MYLIISKIWQLTIYGKTTENHYEKQLKLKILRTTIFDKINKNFLSKIYSPYFSSTPCRTSITVRRVRRIGCPNIV